MRIFNISQQDAKINNKEYFAEYVKDKVEINIIRQLKSGEVKKEAGRTARESGEKEDRVGKTAGSVTEGTG